MRAYERLIRYAQIHTASAEDAAQTPSTLRQFDLSRLLAQEMQQMGFAEVYEDEHAYVYGALPASPGCENSPALGLIAHIDTVPDFSGENVRPLLHPDYDGQEISLGDSGRVLSPARFPGLAGRLGHTLITTDGTTVLGADDKAGVAEILTACEQVLAKGLPHGRIAVCFTQDEEVGHGAALLDLERLAADFAFTVDGGAPEEINYETFNAASAHWEIHGFNVHPGSAKGKMINAGLVAMEINAMLPEGETPAQTEGYQGFYHLTEIKGSVERAEMDYIVRDHDAEIFRVRLQRLEEIAQAINQKYGEGTADLRIRQQYRNMAEKLQECTEVVEMAKEAIRKAGLSPRSVPIRGGTDGAQLSFRGLPCPNLGTGGDGFHGPYEHISVESMDQTVEILLHLIQLVAQQERQQ